MTLTLESQTSQKSSLMASYREGLPLTPEEQKTLDAMESMAFSTTTPFGEEIYYEAADPGYKRFFTRDSLKTAALAGSEAMLMSQIQFSARRLGKTCNPLTGAKSQASRRTNGRHQVSP